MVLQRQSNNTAKLTNGLISPVKAYVDLSFNRICDPSHLKTAFSATNYIAWIRLASNCLTHVSSDVFTGDVNGGTLTFIDMSSNVIEEINDDAFANLVNLQYLMLRNNSIRVLNQTVFKDLNSLKGLDLGMNKLLAIHKYLFGFNKQLLYIEIDANYEDLFPVGNL